MRSWLTFSWLLICACLLLCIKDAFCSAFIAAKTQNVDSAYFLWKYHCTFFRGIFWRVGVCAPAAPFVSFPLTVPFVNEGGICNRRHTYTVNVFQFCFSGFSKGWIRLLPEDFVWRWKPAQLSHGDGGTKAWWIRAAVFAPEPMSDKQSQHRLGYEAAAGAVIADWL